MTVSTEDFSRLLTALQVCELLGISKSCLYDWQNPESPRHRPDFPKPVRLGPNMVRWRKQDIEAWIAALPEVE
jgi:prophage regulatory protein